MKRKAKSIGQMTNSRVLWGFNAGTRVKKNSKGKGSYNRQQFKKHERD